MKLTWLLCILVCLPFLGTAQKVKRDKYGMLANCHYPEGEREVRIKTTEEFKPGTPFPDFKYEDINGKTVTLKAFKGKYILIDFWATYCGPCLDELPYLRKLEETMKGKNIVFVSISRDRDRKAWENMLKKDKLGGVQWFSGKDEKIKTAIGLTTIPRFILLDRKGRVVKIYMDRPSEPETLKILQALKGI